MMHFDSEELIEEDIERKDSHHKFLNTWSHQVFCRKKIKGEGNKHYTSFIERTSPSFPFDLFTVFEKN